MLISGEIAHWLGVAPLGFLGVRRWRNHPVEVACWWLALAFAVSFLADLAAHWADPWTLTFVYVISQSALVSAVFLSRQQAVRLLIALCVVGFVAIAVQALTGGRDYLLHTVAWLSVACLAWEEAKGRLRTALVVYFGVGAVAYLAMAAMPGWPTWIAYQLSRLAGILTFCWACAALRPQLTVHRPYVEARVA